MSGKLREVDALRGTTQQYRVRIEALEAENRRLREALERWARQQGAGMTDAWGPGTTPPFPIPRPDPIPKPGDPLIASEGELEAENAKYRKEVGWSWMIRAEKAEAENKRLRENKKTLIETVNGYREVVALLQARLDAAAFASEEQE